MILYKKNQLFALIFILWQCVFCAQSHANFDKAFKKYEEGLFEEAFIAFKALAAIGDRGAQFNLGVMYYRGEFVEKDPIKAYAWMAVSNKGEKDSNYVTTANKVFLTLDEMSQKKAIAEYNQLLQYYDNDIIQDSIFPKPLPDEDCEPDYLPIVKVGPKYPHKELMAGKMGLVQTEYTVSPEGYARDIIVNNFIGRGFVNPSVGATKKFRYKPAIVGGVAIPAYGVRNVFTYVIEGTTKIYSKQIISEFDELKIKSTKGHPAAQYIYATRLNMFRSFSEYLKGVDLQYKTANTWYEKSAKQGVVEAQYQMGINMLDGRGCKVDKENGLKWINVSAVGGYSPAQQFLARRLLESREETRSRLAMSWLRNSSLDKHYPSKLLLAWELSTSIVESIRDGQEALNLLDEKPQNYYDDVRILETKAAAMAETGNFKLSVKFQKKAIDKAENLEWEIPLMQQRLESYQHNEPWRGGYYNALPLSVAQ